MNILSIYTALPTSVSIFQDGRIIAATQEERFSRKKNDESFPAESIKYCLEQAGLAFSDLDAIAIAGFVGASFEDTVTRKSRWSVKDYLREQYERWLPISMGKPEMSRSLLEIFPEKIDLKLYPKNILTPLLEDRNRNEIFQKDRAEIFSRCLDYPKNKIHYIEHHRCHAAYSYYASPFRGERVLALTVDGIGDGLNATIGIFDETGAYERVYQTNECNIGRIYRYMTLLLGMKPNEHEFKVMGLAPYGKEKYSEDALKVFKQTLFVDGIEFKWHEKPSDSYFWFRERLEGMRFDSIAYALQVWVEDLLVEWVKNSILHFDISKVVMAGGVAMNIKAMGKIAALPCVSDIFIGGSASDESMAVSAGICLAEDLTILSGGNWDSRNIESLPHLYLGPKATSQQEDILVGSLASSDYDICREPTASQIAELLYRGKILARCAGRMEFGQRSLGNRSILADPANLIIKDKINAAVKSRDFWMPFAPVMLDTYVDRYLINPKNIKSPHMTIGFETTPEGYEAMIAACHPGDRTARAQILHQDANPDLYELLLAFELVSGRGALLNTSFNLHGHPIVNTPEDALYVFENSGLDGLILNEYLILKK